MAVPTFLSTAHRYLRVEGVTDVADIITNFENEVTSSELGWTEPSSGLYQSPTDDDGNWFDVLLTAIDAQKLEVRVRNKLGTVCNTRRFQIDTDGTLVSMSTGTHHFCINSHLATWEGARGGLLDLEPESQTAHTQNVWFWASRNTSNSIGESVSWGDLPGVSLNGGCCHLRTQYGSWYSITKQGANLYLPVLLWKIATVPMYYAGRAYQFYWAPGVLGNDTEVQVPIDVDTLATFRVLGITMAAQLKLAVRAD